MRIRRRVIDRSYMYFTSISSRLSRSRPMSLLAHSCAHRLHMHSVCRTRRRFMRWFRPGMFTAFVHMQNSRSIRIMFWGSWGRHKVGPDNIWPTACMFHVTDFHYAMMRWVGTAVNWWYVCQRRIFVFCWQLYATCRSVHVYQKRTLNINRHAKEQRGKNRLRPPDTCLINICKLFLPIWASEERFMFFFLERPLGSPALACQTKTVFFFSYFNMPLSACVDLRLGCVPQRVSPVRKQRIGLFAFNVHSRSLPDTRTHTPTQTLVGRKYCEMFSFDRQIFKHKLILTHVTFRVNSI